MKHSGSLSAMARRRAVLCILAIIIAQIVARPALGQVAQWSNLATVSNSTSLQAGSLCATDGRDIYCNSSVATLSGLAQADRITSGTAGVFVSNTGVINFRTGGVATGYFDTAGLLVAPGISITTANGISSTSGYFSRKSFFGENARALAPFVSASNIISGALYIAPGTDYDTNNDGFLTVKTSVGGAFFLGRQLGTTYSNNRAVFTAETDNPNGASNLFFRGTTSGTTKVSIRADGFAYFANKIGIGVISPSAANALEVSGTVSATRFVGDGSGLTGIASSSVSLALDDLTDAASNVTNDNLFIGNGTGALNTGVSNTAIGLHAFASNTTGTRSTALGSWALTSNTTGGWNTAIGNAAMRGNISGGYNTAVGQAALLYNPAGTGNTAIGQASMLYSTNGNYNTAVGVNTLNTLVYAPNSVISYTTAVGAETAKNFRNGELNVFVGSIAANVLTSGSYNLLIGANVAPNLTGGSGNLVLGSGVGAYAANIDNYLNISNTIVADMTSSASQRAKVGINVISPTSSFEVSGTVSATDIRLSSVATPPAAKCASAADEGRMVMTANGPYVCQLR